MPRSAAATRCVSTSAASVPRSGSGPPREAARLGASARAPTWRSGSVSRKRVALVSAASSRSRVCMAHPNAAVLDSSRPALAHLVSIVVPVYNEGRTVTAVLDRLLSVPLPAPREVLVVNDGSTDGTRDVLDAYPARD